MFQIFFVIILFLLFCKPDPLPKYETYLYKPTSKGVGKDLKEYINKIEVENNIDYSKNSNPTAYIPPMCYTKTVDRIIKRIILVIPVIQKAKNQISWTTQTCKRIMNFQNQEK
jgi:hypothetical protein